MNHRGAPLVIVGMSGGVDSAVAALRLLDAGYQVQALHMTNWDSEDAFCTAAEDYQDARIVCSELGISLHHVNFARQYREKVFAEFLAELRRGRTPNPDVACNREIKFGDCLEYSRRLGADLMATGHYARTVSDGGQQQLLKGADHSKDQSYFLAGVHRSAFASVLFPLGELHKEEVRQIANDRGLPNHARRDSTGICFIGERPFRTFLQNFLPPAPGAMVTPGGQVVGKHAGLMYYTLGQRQGLEIGGLREHGNDPWYVAAKDAARNELIVVQGREHPLLWKKSLHCEGLNWLNPPLAGEFTCAAKTRYRQRDVGCTVQLLANNSAVVTFADPVWAVTPGQQVVFYRGEECLGGGAISALRVETDAQQAIASGA